MTDSQTMRLSTEQVQAIHRTTQRVLAGPNVASPLVQALLAQVHLEFAVLVGSRATGTARPDSDWDIALQWSPQLEWLTVLDLTETLRRTLAEVLQTSPSAIDLIELRRANLAMRASVAEEGLPLTGQDTLAWAHFLQRTWRDMEDFYWRKRHAA